MGEGVDWSRIGTTVVDRDADDEVLERRLGVLRGHVEVPIVVEDTGVQQFELLSPSLPRTVLCDQLLVGIGALWMFVEPLHVGVGRCRVEIEVVLLDVFAVVSLGRREAEGALFEVWVPLMSECECQDQDLIAVAEPGEIVLTPSIRRVTRQILRREFPGVAFRAVVLADRAPGALRHVRSPTSPSRKVAVHAGEAFVLFRPRVRRCTRHVRVHEGSRLPRIDPAEQRNESRLPRRVVDVAPTTL
jgi:hypothetical protein